MDGVDTVVLGVKNRVELAECLEAEALGALPPELRARIDGLGLARGKRGRLGILVVLNRLARSGERDSRRRA